MPPSSAHLPAIPLEGTVPMAIVAPGVAILLTTLAFKLVGGGVRDARDPNLRG